MRTRILASAGDVFDGHDGFGAVAAIGNPTRTFRIFMRGLRRRGKKLPPILTKDQLLGSNGQFPYQTHAYELAAKIRR